MSSTRRQIHAAPERVWEVLADPDNYAHWVVGSRDVRDADEGFPAVGTAFAHTLGFGPIRLRDHSSVLESVAPKLLVLHVKGRPLGRATVRIELEPADGQTRVTLHEAPASPFARLAYNPLADLLLHGRNVEALRRLAELAEGRQAKPTTSRNRDPGPARDARP